MHTDNRTFRKVGVKKKVKKKNNMNVVSHFHLLKRTKKFQVDKQEHIASTLQDDSPPNDTKSSPPQVPDQGWPLQHQQLSFTHNGVPFCFILF
uniref:Uncharacterized protein n=1 Tax=Anguilla anguilla TaxID=7936 RepID=A0A0E9QQR2_ANGAN